MKWRTGVILLVVIPVAGMGISCKHSNVLLPKPATTTTLPPKPPVTPAASSTTPPAPVVAVRGTAPLDCLAKNEGNPAYDRVHLSGIHFGRYGFSQETWNGVVGRAGYPEYVGRNPIEAPPHVQDAAATLLYEERGTQPWPPSVGVC